MLPALCVQDYRKSRDDFAALAASSVRSILEMHPDTGDQRRTTIPVVPRVAHVLHVRPDERSPPNMRVVVALDEVLPSVPQPAIPQQESATTELRYFWWSAAPEQT